ncbi:hypothetical protein C0989_007293 [Termitomyces sp. Mn162]|nr:hypothetical protein C0989_007293 [Termitomyces sp. Mn162]
MAPNHPIPTTPRKNPVGPAIKLPCTPPTTHPSSGQNLPDNFALLQHSVKHDMHQVILAVLHLPLSAQAVIGFCRVAAGISRTQADCAQYLSTMQLVQYQQEAEELKQQTQDQDINMLAYKLNLLAHCFNTLSLLLSQTKPNGKPKPKKLEVLPTFSNLKPGSEAMLLLLGQIDAALEAVQLANNDTLLPCADLQKHYDAIQLAMQQQLYLLNIALQVYKLILACLIHLNRTLGPFDVECIGDLLNNLQVSSEVFPPF